MFKQAAFAALAATAFIAAPASAATFLTVTNTSPALCVPGEITCNFAIAGEVGSNGAFSLTSNTFVLPGSGTFSGSATNSASGNTNIDFSSIVLTNTTTSTSYVGSITNAGAFSFATVGPSNVAGGLFTLTLGGTATVFSGPPASFPTIGGSAVFNAVPEPATWALFILGFGAIGHTMRRRSSKVRVAKASLNFA